MVNMLILILYYLVPSPTRHQAIPFICHSHLQGSMARCPSPFNHSRHVAPLKIFPRGCLHGIFLFRPFVFSFRVLLAYSLPTRVRSPSTRVDTSSVHGLLTTSYFGRTWPICIRTLLGAWSIVISSMRFCFVRQF